MVANIEIQEVVPTVDRSAELEAEIADLQAEVRRLTERLTAERAHRGVLQRAVGYATARARALERDGEILVDTQIDTGIDTGIDNITVERSRIDGVDEEEILRLHRERRDLAIDENLYVFDDEDESRAAFDRFFAAPDPHLEKVRGFLLD